MNGVAARFADGPAEVGFTQRPLWALVLVALVLSQAATTLALFDADRSWRPLLDDRPILNGRHPLHLYHGELGAQSWLDRNFGSAYDPAFQAGYPKTPVFDSGSRPAELFLLLGRDRLYAYKMGIAILCVLVPVCFAGAARLVALGPGVACLAAALGQLAWWGCPAQQLLRSGEIEWLLAELALLLHAACLVRYHRAPGTLLWLGLFVTAVLAWLNHPLLAAGFCLLLIPYYVFTALAHGIMWHVGLVLAWGGALLVNHGWLQDWFYNCWLYRPIPLSPVNELARSLGDWWTIDLGADRPDRLLAGLLLGGGLVGVLALLVRGRSAAGLIFGATALVLPALSLGSSSWEPLYVVGAPKLFVLACAFAVVPCAAAGGSLFLLLRRLTPQSPVGTFLGILVLAVAAIGVRHDLHGLIDHGIHAQPFTLGLTPEQRTLAKTLRQATRADARILWEERREHPTPYWSALLPWRTQRSFLGGLCPEAGIEHAFARLTGTTLAGRPLSEWTDAELDEFCQRYNVGYVVCWSPEVAARFRAWSMVDVSLPIQENGSGLLLTVRRKPSYVLKGKARVIQMDAQRIALADVEPEDGVLLLSLHHHEGFRISPSTVTVERAPDAYDPIPFLRLRLPGPVARLTLTWED